MKEEENKEEIEIEITKTISDVLCSALINLQKIDLPKIEDIQTNLNIIYERITKSIEPVLRRIEEDKTLTDEEFKNKYKKRYENSLFIGNAGWVASPHGNTADIYEWCDKIKDNEKIIIDFFDGEKGEIDNILNELNNCFKEYDKRFYYEKAYSFFINKDYMTAAYYFLSLIDDRVNTVFDFGEHKKYSKKYNLDSLDNQFECKYRTIKNGTVTKYILLLDLIPSLWAYLNKLYNDKEYKFENNIEPPYLNRNWLFHGRSKREVTRKDCLQLINALDAIEFINKCSTI